MSNSSPVTAYLGLGANLGDRTGSIHLAVKELDALPTTEVMRVSSLYETAPVGVANQPDFLNAVAEVQTCLGPEDLLAAILHLEKKMGRTRTERWGPRVIDIDVLLYGDQKIDVPGLTVPHPRLRERAFALVPLAEIAPTLALPGETQSVSEIANILAANGNIRRVGVV